MFGSILRRSIARSRGDGWCFLDQKVSNELGKLVTIEDAGDNREVQTMSMPTSIPPMRAPSNIICDVGDVVRVSLKRLSVLDLASCISQGCGGGETTGLVQKALELTWVTCNNSQIAWSAIRIW